MNKTYNAHERKRKTASRRKKELALALAVSLWIATGGAASAEDNPKLYIDIDANDKVTATGGDPAATGGTVAPAVNTIAADKTLTVRGGDWSGWNIYGGYSATGNAEKTTVTIVHDSLPDTSNVYAVYGGYSQDDIAKGNTVNLTNSHVSENVYGGYSQTGRAGGTGEGEGNTVNLTNSHVVGFVYGGYSYSGNATGNTVNLTNSSNGSGVYGGRSQSGKATGNTVTIVNDSLPAASNVYEVYGGYGKNGATDNTVNLTNANTGSVSGGDSYRAPDYPPTDHVTGNTLHLSGTNKVSSVSAFETIYIEKAIWGTPVLEVTGNIGNSDSIDASKLTFANPETIPDGATMNLIECTENNGTITPQLATPTTTQTYDLSPVTGVTVNASLTGSLAFGNFDADHGNKPKTLTYTASNKATKLTFTDVEWKDSDALLDHATTLTGVSFDGADVDTSNISFKNLNALKNNEEMTLVSNFGDTVGTITGTKYKVGTTLEGEGKASLSGKDLIFTTGETGGNNDDNRGLIAREQTHNTVMGASVSMAAISAGSEFVGAATEGLALASNAGADGVSSFAQMGGGSMRQETGSHVDTHTWNAILALGHQNKKERGTMEYGAFFEYGTGNYTTHADNGLRGDGSTRYTGGGLLAKWTAKGGNYIEGSLRAGSVHDDARNVLSDGLGNPYSYETNAPYLGGHIGVGKEIPVAGGNTVDVYGKYFYNRKNGVSFNAGGHYDLDAVTSQIIRIGARYTIKRDKWDFYAGAAYEHELDGKANGTADGVAIRSAEIKGGSARLELGATMKPDKNSPWSLDLNVAGFAGKKQGVSGGVSVSFTF